ncbi:MAG: hypothetical protein Q9219_006810 [cf. Caloplaca sp. 3 TL-2023]
MRFTTSRDRYSYLALGWILQTSIQGLVPVQADDASLSKRAPAPNLPANFSLFAALPFWPYRTFATDPDFHAPVLEISRNRSATDGLFVFAPLPFVPVYPDRFIGGLIMDQLGNPVWHTPNEGVGQLQVQQLNGQNVLTFFTGGLGGNSIDAHGFGAITILDNTYRQIGAVTLNNGTFLSGDSLQNAPQPSYVDIHESLITPQGTMLVTAYNSTPFDLSAVGGPRDGWILDSQIYEIDIKTNRTLFRWSSIEHVDELPLNGSHQLNPDGSIINGNNATHPWDYFLTNSINPINNGYILSARHYWSVIALDLNGNVSWNLNGDPTTGDRGGDFTRINQAENGPSTFSWQHDVRPFYPPGRTRSRDLTIDMFNNNNNGLDNGTAPSTALTLRLDPESRTVETVSALQDPNDILYVASQGTFQRLLLPAQNNNHKFVAYGQIPVFKEFDADDNVVLTARFGQDNQASSYRSYLTSNWSATPYYPPKAVVTREGNGSLTLSMSWNGATPDVYDGWVLYESEDIEGEEVGRVPGTRVARTGYESNATLAVGTRVVVAEAVRGRRGVRRSERVVVG